MTALYVDLEEQELLEESWVAKEGQLVLDSQRQIIADRDFHWPRLTWTDTCRRGKRDAKLLTAKDAEKTWLYCAGFSKCRTGLKGSPIDSFLEFFVRRES